MRVDLSRVQQASALASDSDESDRDVPPEWDSRSEPFDAYYGRAQQYIHQNDHEASPLLPSPFLRPHERVSVGNREPLDEGKRYFLSCSWKDENSFSFLQTFSSTYFRTK